MNNFIAKIRTDSRGRRKGSVSVEASLVFPLFFFFIMLFFRLFLLIMTECYVAKAVCSLSSDMASVSYAERALLKEKVTAPALLCYPELFATLGKNQQIENLRIICLEDEEKNVEIQVFYDFSVQAPGLPGFTLPISQQFLIRTFIGIYDSDKLVATEGGTEDKEDEEGETVYITEKGQAYHLSRTCTYLSVTVEEVAADQVVNSRNSSGGKYYQCEKCKSSRNTGRVYITAYGNRYHLSAQCSSLYRDVKEISKDQVGNRRPCSKCGGG